MLRILNEKETLSKAAITSGSFTAGIGISEEEADRFIDFIIDESGLKDQVRLERMDANTKNIDKLDLGGKVLKPAVAAVDPGETVSITTSQVKLEAKEIIAIVRISDDTLEDNIEGDAFADHLLGMIARASANELEDALLYGRALTPGSPTEITQLWQGWISEALDNGNVVDAAGAGFSDRFIDREKMSALVKSLPTKFRRNKRELRASMADDIDQDWADEVLAGRATALGDNALTGDSPNRYRGIAFRPSGLFRTNRPVLVSGGMSSDLDNNESAGDTVLEVPDTSGIANGEKVVIARGTATEEVGTVDSFVADTSITLVEGLQFDQVADATVEEATDDGTDVLLANYQNLILGIQRDFRVEPDRLPRLRATDWVVTMRVDAKVEEATALALLTSLKVR